MIRNLIFDLGGVLLNLDLEKTADAFRALGMHDFDTHYTQARQSGLFDDFDRGLISPEAFREALRAHLPAHTSSEAIDKAWNAMLLDLPEERLELLKSLAGKYRVFLLSNTNEIHVEAFSAYLNARFGFRDFSEYFENWYYSCRIGKRKPDVETFHFVQQANQLRPEETLFIDDSIQHVEGARKAGLQAVWLAPGEEVVAVLQKILRAEN